MIARNRSILAGTVSVLALTGVPSAVSAQDVSGASSGDTQVAEKDAGDSDIVVTAIRRSLETSQAIKRESDQIVDSIVAEDVGKLPDVTATESLARITGVQVNYAQGGASGTRVRGLPDLATTFNGREIFSAEGRSVALQDFPASSLARLDVYKSGSANLLEAGIGGLVDVRSRRPLDFKGDRITGGINGAHWFQSQKLGVDANLLISKRWETGIGDIGFLIEGSYTDIKFLEAARNVSQTITSRNLAGVGQIRYPSFVNIDYPNGNRWRPSVASVLQWRPNNELEMYADFLFQGYRGRNNARNLQILSGDAATLSNIEFFPGTNLVKSMTATAGGIPIGTQQVRDETGDTYQGAAGFVWNPGRLRLSGDVAYTDSTYILDTFAFNFALVVPQPTRSFDFDTDVGVGGGTVVISNFDLNDPARYRMASLSETGQRGSGNDVQARLDADYRLDTKFITNLQAGVRFNDRNFAFSNYSVSGNAPAGRFYTLLPLEYTSASPGFRNDEVDITRVFLTPTRESLIANADALRALVGRPAGQPALSEVFNGNEKTYTGYIQARYELDLGGMPIDGLLGLRAIRTDDQISGFDRVTTNGQTAIIPVSRENSYTDYLPNISARLRITPKLQLRLAFTETRSRPNFSQLNPSLTVGAPSTVCNQNPDDPDCIRIASGGNADLKPIKSNNYDASLEWYFSKSGSLTLGAFQRDVTGFISNFTTDVVDGEYGRLRVTRPFNGDSGRLRGIEAAFQTFLRFPGIPDWARNFGVMANYTYIDHASELPEDLAATLPGKQPIAGVSDHLANVAAFYENTAFSLRLAYNYRSKFVVSYGRVNDPALGVNVLGPTLPVIEDGRGSLDFNGTVNPTPNITVFFNASNILGAAATNRRQFNAEGQSYPWQVRFIESVYRLGVRFRF